MTAIHVQCCACKKVKDGDQWKSVTYPEAIAPYASHTYCIECEMDIRRQINEMTRGRKRARTATLSGVD